MPKIKLRNCTETAAHGLAPGGMFVGEKTDAEVEVLMNDPSVRRVGPAGGLLRLVIQDAPPVLDFTDPAPIEAETATEPSEPRRKTTKKAKSTRRRSK